jgi:DeoR/GlpR family transcriptional regulator of sugar metabolism
MLREELSVSAQDSREQRHEEVLKVLREAGTATVSDLGQRLGVAEMTIRRDLEALEATGVLQRFHGGARLNAPSAFEPPFAFRERTNSAGKRSIAAAVARLVEDGETVIVDGGSTGLAVAAALEGRHLTVCPLSLRVAWAFERSTSVDLLLAPGVVRRGELSVSGAETIEFLRAHHFDRYILTASALSLEDGFTEWNVEDAAVKRASIVAARTVVAAVDSAKFGRSAFVEICPVVRPDVVVLDRHLEGDGMTALRAASQLVVVADEAGAV